MNTDKKLFITRDSYVPDMDNETYHNRIAGINPVTGGQEPVMGKSSLTKFSRSPAHYQASLRYPVRQTPRMKDGTDGHTCLLEPERFEAEHKEWLETHCVKPAFTGRGAKINREAWKAENPHLTAMTELQYNTAIRRHENLLRMRDCVLSYPEVAEILSHSDGKAEHSFFCLDPEINVWLKARPDWLIPEAGLYYDLKFTPDARPHTFRNVASRLKYHWHVIYQDVLEIVTGDRPEIFFLVVEFEYPHCPKIYPVSEETSIIATTQYREQLMRFRECLDTGVWPGYDPVIEEEPLNFTRNSLWIDDSGTGFGDYEDGIADDEYDDYEELAAYDVAA